MLFYNGGFYNDEKLKSVFVFIIFAVLLGEIGKVDNVAYNSTFAYLVYMALLTRAGLRINRYCSMADFPFYDPVQRPIMRHRAKFRVDRSNHSGDIADFRFSRWRPSAILDLFYACRDHPLRVLGGLCKFGCNRRSNVDSMQILIFCALSLKMHVHAPKIGGFGGFYPRTSRDSRRRPPPTKIEDTYCKRYGDKCA